MQNRGRRGGAAAAPVRRRRAPRSRPAGGGDRDRRRLAQLLVSLTLFLLVFVGRGVFPEQLHAWGEFVSRDADFQAAWLALLDAMGAGGEQDGPEPPAGEELPLLSRGSRLGLDFAAQNGLPASLASARPAPEEEPEPAQEQEPSPEIVTAVAQAYTDDGVALPSNVSFTYYELGLEETAVPVQGSVTSTFGYRDSPIDGDNEFHLALDIGAAEGTAIGAFAAGTVEYIGQSDEFGLYLKIRHDNNVASFYAHCSQLLVSKGDEVACGQTVALVGSTGNATGPHLHLTIEKDDIRLNPAYYVDLS